MKDFPLLECVPNFSYGQNDIIFNEIIQSINKINGQKLLHIDSNLSANRTVVTFAGSPKSVVEAAFQAVKKAQELIDMRFHQGTHPRIGATDVLPLVPLRGLSMEDALFWSHQLAKRIGDELHIPIYLYEYSSKRSYRNTLVQIRKGQYEGLAEKMQQKEWYPDYGPLWNSSYQNSIKRSGATVLGVRNILVALNVSLNTTDESIANSIAQKIRSSGYWEVDMQTGQKIKQEGLFSDLRAIGWYIEDFGQAQVSMNFLNYKKTSPLMVWESIQKLAGEYGCEAIGCELIGLIPESCILEAGAKATQLSDTSKIKESSSLLAAGIEYLGLNKVKPFDPDLQILERALMHANLL